MNFKLKTTLMHHQQEAVACAIARPVAFAHLAETGTGKSAMVLAEFQRRLGGEDIMDLLVIGPAGSIKNWYIDKSDDQPSELNKHLDQRLLDFMIIASNVQKASAKKALDRLLKEKHKPRALFINIEALSRGKNSKAELICREFMSLGRTMLVIDESTKIRRHESARSKAVLRIGKLARSRRILTGLVTPRSPLDLFTQFNFLDERILEHKLFSTFRARYAVMKFICRAPESIIDDRLRQLCWRRGLQRPNDLKRDAKVEFIYAHGGWLPDTIPIIEDYKNLGELRAKIKPFSHQVLKADCLDLDPKTYEFRDVELTDEQKRVYKDMLEASITEIEKDRFTSATTVLSKIMRLRQIICGHIRDENGDIKDIPSLRVSSIIDVLEEHDGKAVIWITYNHELLKIADALRKECGPASVACYWGGNYNIRDEEEKRFLNDPECRYMLSTAGSGGLGNTWVVANLVIYAANDYDLEHRYQSEDRTHRYGQINRVTYIDLIARGTVEEKIIMALRHKIDLTRAITGETYRQWLV